MNIDLVIFVGLAFVFVYFIMKQFFHHKKFNYLQQTAIAILIGTICGVFVNFFTNIFKDNNFGQDIRQTIFLILLPPMLFQDGYNIPKRKFFQNILYINLFGIFGTILNFFTIALIVYAFNANNLITSIQNSQRVIVLQNWQILAFSIVLCSIDTVVPQKVVNGQRFPKLFSIIFGQSILKDTITVTMFGAIISVYQKFEQKDLYLSAQIAGSLILQFGQITVVSILIGTFGGLISTFTFRKLRFLLQDEGVSQIALVFITGYMTYILSQWAGCSGVISMLFCGIILSHFNIYNLSQKGKQSTKTVITMLKVIAQGLLFFLLGLFIFNIQSYSLNQGEPAVSSFSLVLLAVGFLALFIGRFLNIYLMSLIGYLIIGKKKWRLNIYEYFILYVSGLVKGAVPFALVLILPQNSTPQTNCVQTSIVFIVYISSLFFNTILPKFLKIQLRCISKLRKEDPNHPSLKDSLILNDSRQIKLYFEKLGQQFQQKKNVSHSISQSVASNNQKFFTKVKSTTQKYWRKFEEGKLKPFLIYDYYQRKEKIKLQKLQKKREEYLQYMKKFDTNKHQNILSIENEQENHFVDVKLSENSSSCSYNSEQKTFKVKKVVKHHHHHQKNKQKNASKLQSPQKKQGLSQNNRISIDISINQNENKEQMFSQRKGDIQLIQRTNTLNQSKAQTKNIIEQEEQAQTQSKVQKNNVQKAKRHRTAI